MNNCKEFLLDDVKAITAIPVEDYNLGTAAWQIKPIISEEYFSPILTNAIVIGRQAVVADGTLIPIVSNSGKVKDSESDTVSGRRHAVSTSCEVDDRDSEVWNNLLTLERTPCHLLLTFRNGQPAFVAATEDTYTCTVERDGSKTTVTFKIECLMGIQLIV